MNDTTIVYDRIGRSFIAPRNTRGVYSVAPCVAAKRLRTMLQDPTDAAGIGKFWRGTFGFRFLPMETLEGSK